MCLALGNTQQLNIIIYEYLYIVDVQMSGFFCLFVLFCFFKPYSNLRLDPYILPGR